jgi:hypothetical protein
VKVERLYLGPIWSLHGLVVNDVCLIREFISSLEHKYLTQVASLINHIGDQGPPTNKKKFRHLGDKIYELKTGGGIRILNFFGGAELPQSLILIDGFMKPKARQLKREQKKAVKLRKEYFESVSKVKKLKKKKPRR